MERTFQIHVPETYLWDPQPDITAYELALCVPMMHSPGFHHQFYDQLPTGAKRHWRSQDKRVK